MARTPKWLKSANFYEIYPQSFLDTNGDGIGDIKGILKKLDYIESMGFDALWLNPLFLSPFFDAGYDVTDFRKVAPRYGTNKELTKLFLECHRRGIRVLLDLVAGHTAIDSPWFAKSCKAKKNEYSDYFLWTDGVWSGPKDLPMIRGFAERNGAVITNFFSIQPALNYGYFKIENPWEESYKGEGPKKVIKAIQDVIRFWLDKGADGFRCDMAGWLVKRDEDFEGTVSIWKEIFAGIDKDYPEAAFVSEWNCPRRSLEAGFDMDFLLQDEFNQYNSRMTRDKEAFFKLNSPTHDSSVFMNYYLEQLTYARKYGAHLAMITGNHDTIRLKKSLSNKEIALYYLFLYTLPCVPFLYYGDELGLPYEEGLPSVEGGYQRTGSRSPMPWNDKKNAGFSTNDKTYIKVDPSYRRINVEKEEKDPRSLLRLTKCLLHIRKREKELWDDREMTVLSAKKDDPFLAYLRGKNLLVLFNVSSETREFSLDRKIEEEIFFVERKSEIQGKKILVPPQSACLLRLK